MTRALNCLTKEWAVLLHDIADTLRKAGCALQEVPGWTTRNRGELSGIRAIIIHHTAGAATGDYPSLPVVRDGRSDLPGPLAQLGVGRSGLVYVFSSGKANHSYPALRTEWTNAYTIGIEVESVGTGPLWPLVQIHGAARAAAVLCVRYALPVSAVLGHKEVCSPPGRKPDPVGIPGDMPEFRALVQQYMNGDGEMPLTPEDLNAVWMFPCTGIGPDGKSQTHPAVAWVTAMAFRVASMEQTVAQLAGRNPVDVDEAAIAADLAPMLVESLALQLPSLQPADFDRIAVAVADEQARRMEQ